MLQYLPTSVAAFEIDATSGQSRVALVYGVNRLGSTDIKQNTAGGDSNRSLSRGTTQCGPQVWFQDKGGRWFFIANSFMDYFRLMVTHLGLPGWQYAYTDVGLDPICKQWFNYLMPKSSQSQERKVGGSGGSTGTNDPGGRHDKGKDRR